ncbi:MAG: hypothetical protein ACNA8W_12195 [Bradymonadaceae bacterium]
MKQQDLWQWVELETDLERMRSTAARSAARGRLVLDELPSDMRLVIGQVQALQLELEQELGTVDLILTDNRRRMVRARKRRERFELRLHHMFIGCDAETCQAIVALARGGEDVDDSRKVVRDYIQANRDAIRFEFDPDELQSRGEHFDLAKVVEDVRLELKDESLEGISITWGRYGRGRRSIRLGSYDFDQRLVRIHPVLDQDWVPRYFIEFIVYHELLHALIPPEQGETQRRIHTEEFRAMEKQFSHYEKALAWEKEHIEKLLNR